MTDHNTDALQGARYGLRQGRPSFPLRHQMLRAAWAIAWLVLAAWTPPPLHAWRRLILRAFGAQIAKGARVYGSARIWYPPNLAMKSGAVLGWQTFVYSQAPVTIGERAVVSQFARLITGSHDIDDDLFQLFARPITIEADAWVAAAALVGPGVTIGEGAVLGGGAVAFGDLAPWGVYVGNPAKHLRNRKHRHL